MITVSVQGSRVETNNVNAVDYSTTHLQTTYNHTSTVMPSAKITSTSSRFLVIKGAKSRLPSIKSQLDEVLVELQFISEQGYDEDQYKEIVALHSHASTAYYELEAGTRGLVQSLMNSSHAKELKAEVKLLHKTVMSASEATKRELGLKRNAAQRAAQRATPHLAPPLEPSPHPCCTHTEQPQITITINICGQLSPSHSH